jgi:hypothetical protein
MFTLVEPMWRCKQFPIHLFMRMFLPSVMKFIVRRNGLPMLDATHYICRVGLYSPHALISMFTPMIIRHSVMGHFSTIQL